MQRQEEEITSSLRLFVSLSLFRHNNLPKVTASSPLSERLRKNWDGVRKLYSSHMNTCGREEIKIATEWEQRAAAGEKEEDARRLVKADTSRSGRPRILHPKHKPRHMNQEPVLMGAATFTCTQYWPLFWRNINATQYSHWHAMSMLHVLKLHSLSWPPGGDSSGCIEVYASCVKVAFSLLTTRGNSSGCIEVYTLC